MATPFPFQNSAKLTSAQMNAITTLPISTKTASYVAVVGDIGSRIVMNVASANTVTINNSIFAEGDTIFIANKGTGTTTITAGAGVTINGTLTLAQHGGGTLVALSASVFTFFSASGTGYGVATGGTSSSITDGVNYTLLTFTSDGTLTVSTAGLFDIAVFGAGGSGGSGGASSRGGGGGGAGSFNLGTFYLAATTYAVTIGVGGVAVNDSDGVAGTQSLVAGVIAGYGGLGGGFQSPISIPSRATTRGCGGGGSTNYLTWFQNASEFRAFAGGVGANEAGGGGGGGVTAAGSAGSASGGAGGAGYDIGSFVGAGTLFKGGGGGGGGTSGGGAGGSSVGGAGGGSAAAGSSAGANTGSGGGGACTTGGGGGSFGKGGNGGSGIVYVRFKV
jgi:hypothetical protein